MRAAEDGQQRQAGLMAFTAQLGYKKAGKTDFQEIHDRMFSDYYRSNDCEMLCSEFVAKTTIATLVELNDRLKKKYGLDHDVVAIPIDRHENLSVMHPGRFLDILKSKDCIEQVQGPNIVNMYIQREGIEQPQETFDAGRAVKNVFSESKASPSSLSAHTGTLIKGTSQNPEILKSVSSDNVAAITQTSAVSAQNSAVSRSGVTASSVSLQSPSTQENAPLLFQAAKTQPQSRIEENAKQKERVAPAEKDSSRKHRM